MKQIIYLCGAINGCTDAECNDWRQYVKDTLGDAYEYLDPMRRDYRGVEAENVDNLVQGDLQDISDSTIILVNANKPSWGTAMEVFKSFELGKTVLTVCNAERPSPWLIYHSTEIYKTLDDVLSVLKGTLVS